MLRNKTIRASPEAYIYPEHVRNIPIPAATETQQAAIINLVDEILAIKKAAPAADTQKQEALIDALVYDLYGVPEDERK